MEEHDNPYFQLKTQVIAGIGRNFSLEEVKDFFLKHVKSKRSLARVNSPRDMIQLLEKRDLLNSQKVVLLGDLGKLVGNEKVKDLVHSYTKLCLDEESDRATCSICGIPFLSTEQPLSEHQNLNVNIRNSFDADTDLSQALENVALNIGEKWGVLARELNILECHIDICVKAHPQDPVAQARMGLKFWRQTEKENATLDRLDNALEARLCQNKGFGVHLRRPIMTNILMLCLPST